MGGFVAFYAAYIHETRVLEKTVESAAWQAAAAASLWNASTNPASPPAQLLQIQSSESLVHRIEIIKQTARGYEVVYAAGHPPILGRNVFPDSLDSGASVLPGPVPLRAVAVAPVPGGGYALAAAPAPGFRDWMLGNSSGQWAYLGMAFCASALAGLLLGFSNQRYARAFEKLAEAEKRWRDVADAAGEYIWEVDREGKFIYVSDRVREMLGWEPQELLGRHPFELLPPGTRAAVEAHSHHIVASQKPFRDFEHTIRRKDGSTLWVSVNGVPVLDTAGNFVGYRGATLDITPRKIFEQALVREKEAAQAAAMAKSQFLAMMSHEIRTPLNSVIGFTELLAKTSLNNEQREHLAIIRSSGEALLALLNDILEFSRSEILGPEALNPEPTAIREFAASLLELHRPAAEAKGLRLVLAVSPEVPECLLLDQSRVRQIVLNLVGNAVKFTERGRVELRVEKSRTLSEDEEFPVRLAVVDTGPGIPLEKRHLLFQPFSQVESGPARRHGGTGLGLVICRRLAEVFGGAVYLEDSSPKGSTFVFECRFPRAVSPPAALAPTSPTPPPLPANWRPRILVAEDNTPSRKLLRAMLKNLGLDCQEALNGRQAIEMHTTSPCDIIFMDVQMPEMDGLATTRAIRDMEARLGRRAARIVALTADAMAGDRERCLDAGMDDYLCKPLRKEDLLAALERARLHVPASEETLAFCEKPG